jgi:hypothetical protein
MKDALMQVLEDLEQEDLEDVLAGEKKATEIAVQKEQGTLDALEKAREISADMEHWLANKMDTTKWLLENFDKAEMPEIPMLPLADAFEDLVGELLEQQQNIAEDVKGSASNQALAEMPAGWDVMDGVLPSFAAQGKSGNQAPKHNEQMGRSSGGREGMSDGEMAGTETHMLKGDTPDARRTNDAMQQGQVRDKETLTGGGERLNGPVRRFEFAQFEKAADTWSFLVNRHLYREEEAAGGIDFLESKFVPALGNLRVIESVKDLGAISLKP